MAEAAGARSFAALGGVGVLEYGSSLRSAYCGAFLAQLGANVVVVRPPGAPARTAPIDAHATRVLDTVKTRRPDLDSAVRALSESTAGIVLIGDRPGPPPLELPIAVEVRLDVHERDAAGALGGVAGDALSASALSGASIALGHTAREPLSVPEEFAEHTAGLHGAVACLVALMRGAGGAQHSSVVVAMDECLRFYVGMNAKMYEGYPREWHREGRRSAGSAGLYPVGMFPCTDGYVVIVCRSREDWRAIIAASGSPEWATRPGWDDPFIVAERHADEADALLETWLGRLSCEQAVELGRLHGFAIARILDPLEAIDTEQMRSRGFAQPDESGGAPGLDRPTLPLLVTRGERAAPPRARRAAAAERQLGPVSETLAGVRVLDLSWVWSGPAMTMMLAALGADVIKIENSARPDGSRLRGRPSVDGVPVEGPELEVTPYFHQVNAGKRSVELDLGSAEGQATIHAIADSSDVVVENMRPGVLARHGLGYASLSETNPSLVMLSMSLAGQEGPLSHAKGYASIMSALSGMESLIGYSPSDVTGMLTFAVGDPNAATHGVLAVLAALLERERSGRGAWLDLSQLEAVSCGLIGTLGAFGADREAAWGYGNWHPEHAPFGTFPASDGGWVALAVRSDEQWPDFVAAVGDRNLRDEPGLGEAAARRGERKRLNRLTAAATRQLGREELIERLLSAGILAVPVLSLGEHATVGFSAPARHAMRIDHPYAHGEELVTPPWDIDGERPCFARRAPLLGEHTSEVLGTLAGRTPADVPAGQP
jgi:crotonobetainyl-CoA:carnitine CoA-transferase CaiB-like acyl-CoA transferase